MRERLEIATMTGREIASIFSSFDATADYVLQTQDSHVAFVFGEDAAGQRYAKRLRDCWNACKGINPAAVPDLLAACEAMEWGASRANGPVNEPHRMVPSCPACGGIKPGERGFMDDAYGHREWCAIANAIAKARINREGGRDE